MDDSGLPPQRKRVHFSYDEPDPDEDAPRQKRPRFPKGKKESLGHYAEMVNEVFEGQNEGDPIKATDPRVAATERAVRRNQLTEQLLSSEDTSLLTDVTGAEEDYEGSDHEEEDGIKIEPFNLKHEREEGYFDADGNYVEYRNNMEIKDAWLDSTEVDLTVAEKHMKQFAQDEIEERDLSAEQLASIKRRIANTLQPGETVLEALRRFKGTSMEKDRHDKAKMSGPIKALFDQLTEDSMKLLDNGDYNVYHEKKETFQREAEGYESILCAKAAMLASDRSAATSSNVSKEDIFANDEDRSSNLTSNQLNGTAASDRIMSGETLKDRPFSRINENPPVRLSRRDAPSTSTDIFADDNDDEEGKLAVAVSEPHSSSDVVDGVISSSELSGEASVGDSEYVYDESSGYYYNSAMGYYYDPNSSLFCNAASGKWFRFDEESNTYSEIGESTEAVGL